MTNPLKKQAGRRKIFNGSDIKILSEIIKEHTDYHLDEIIKEMIRKTNKEKRFLYPHYGEV
ncbi:hypothetical protein C1645_829098 [Glomus cerebriforme]|uniref:Uncharacterized protein n=1 Tax=Glomus cerebriforme TaxID=658196 RepID=A0A397SPL2_9GLOM|nr:hypothetical protein C1645_829098 [Glomus cerebriforme]